MKGLLILMLGTFAAIIAGSAAAQEKQIVGWVEKVRVFPGNVLLDAKVDTGADHSSIHAFDISEFSRDGNRWIRFCIGGQEGRKDICELQLVRTAKIKRHGAPRLERYVVTLGICIGNFYKEAEVRGWIKYLRERIDHWTKKQIELKIKSVTGPPEMR